MIMGTSIISKDKLLENSLSEEHYFQSLLQGLYSNGLLNIRDIEVIQFETMNILTETLGYYTRNESSSVRVEVAEKVLLSIYYTVGLFLKNNSTINESVTLIKEKGAKYLFAKGEEILKAKVEVCKKLLKHVQETKLTTVNYAYVDTIDYGIPLFFKEYDIRFGSHETPGSIDYPLASDEMKLTGIEYIEDYLNKINLENKFCSNFDISEVEALLKGFNKDSDHMLMNIFQLVLTNYLGRILAGKEGKSLEITEMDRAYIKGTIENWQEEDLRKLILMSAQKICQELSIKEASSIDYINKVILKIIPEIKCNLETGILKNIFITLDYSEETIVKYEDGESVENSIFKCITEEIRECSKVKDKIQIIREQIHSLQDMMDVLSADCIFGDEFTKVFKELDDFEIALLLNNIPHDGDYGTESEKEWQERLKVFVKS